LSVPASLPVSLGHSPLAIRFRGEFGGSIPFPSRFRKVQGMDMGGQVF
jgi:hypothetical protein